MEQPRKKREEEGLRATGGKEKEAGGDGAGKR